jgi:hypothetical protein
MLCSNTTLTSGDGNHPIHQMTHGPYCVHQSASNLVSGSDRDDASTDTTDSISPFSPSSPCPTYSAIRNSSNYTPRQRRNNANSNSSYNYNYKRNLPARSTMTRKKPRFIVEHHYHDHLLDPKVSPPSLVSLKKVRRVSLSEEQEQVQQQQQQENEGYEMSSQTVLQESQSNRFVNDLPLGMVSHHQPKSHEKSSWSTTSSSLSLSLPLPLSFSNHVTFPEILHHMLHQVSVEGQEHIVSWQPHGRCFIVKKKKEFVEQIIPR